MEATNTIVDVKDRLKGMLIGVCVGDALGLNVEFRRTIPKQTYTGYVLDTSFQIQFRYKNRIIDSGSVSDDTEMTLVLLSSVLANGKYDRTSVLLGYMRWANSKAMLGRNTRKMLHGVTTIRGFERRRMRNIENGEIDMLRMQSNGTLMRACPFVLLKDDNVGMIEDCVLTNDNDVNKQCNSVFVTCLKMLLRGEAILDYLTAIVLDEEVEKEVWYSVKQAVNKEKRDVSVNKGWVCHSLYMGLYSVLWFDEFSECMDWVIGEHVGSDTDTNASISGALLGAKLGYSNVNMEEKTKVNIERVIKYFDETSREYKIADMDELVGKMYEMYVA